MAADSTDVQPTTSTASAPSTTSAASSSSLTSSTGTAAVPAGYAPNSSDNHRPFTITATLREEYDDNIFTSKTNQVGSFKTDFSPSILVDFPMVDSDFSARYTFTGTYYDNRNGGEFDTAHDIVAQYRKSFSDRFGLNVAEQFRYSSEPSLFDNTGTVFRNGAYYTNTVNAGFNAQWTPLFGSMTTFSNTIVKYEDATQSIEQDSVENTGTQSFSFAVLPKVSWVVGGIIDDISYDNIDRGYTSYTGNTGIDWQALPSLSLGVRVGGTYTDSSQSSEVSPYASVTLGWQLGARSSLTANYSHDVVPTDVYVSSGQIADRFSTTFRYDITPSLSAHLEGILTRGDYSNSLIAPGTISGFTEYDYALDTGVSYRYNNYLNFEAGYLFSGVSSDLSFRDYTRNQYYIGVRGTY